MRKLFIGGFLLVSLVFVGMVWAGGAQEQSDKQNHQATEVTLILEWIPNTNHTGAFVAQEKGWFEEEGLSVEIKQPTESQTPLMVASKEADFGYAAQETVTFARSSENPVPVRSIATVNRHNTSVFASPVDRNIDDVTDFEGKTYGGWGSEYEEALLQAVMEKAGADFSEVEIVNIGTTDFLGSFRQGIDFRWIFYGWQGIRAEVSDRDFNYISLIDIDPKLDYYTPTIITARETMENEPQTVRAFLRAMDRGYRWAAENPDEAADILITYNGDLDSEFVHASQRYLSKQYLDKEGRWGYMEENMWHNFSDFLTDYDLLQNPFDASAAFTNKFLPGKSLPEEE